MAQIEGITGDSFMGGRGASSGISNFGSPYGSQYHTSLTVVNIKFVSKNSRQSQPLMETMARGCVYAHVEGNDIKSIIYFDNENKRSKQIDIDHEHGGNSPHTHHGYYHNERDSPKGASRLTPDEQRIFDRVVSIWKNRNRGK